MQACDKQSNPILATQASPGMGKSSFIDAICSLDQSMIRKLAPVDATDAFCAAIASSVRIPLDYNGFQTINADDVDRPIEGIAHRIVHSYDFLAFIHIHCI